MPATLLDAAWAEPRQRGRALDSLVADGLVDPLPDGHFALPGDRHRTAAAVDKRLDPSGGRRPTLENTERRPVGRRRKH